MKINNIEMIEEMNREMIDCEGDGEVGLDEYMIGMYGYGMGERLDERLKKRGNLKRDVKREFGLDIRVDMERGCVYLID
jgi:hypothetical protein